MTIGNVLARFVNERFTFHVWGRALLSGPEVAVNDLQIVLLLQLGLSHGEDLCKNGSRTPQCRRELVKLPEKTLIIVGELDSLHTCVHPSPCPEHVLLGSGRPVVEGAEPPSQTVSKTDQFGLFGLVHRWLECNFREMLKGVFLQRERLL